MTHAPTPPQTPFANQRPIGFDKLMPEGRRAPWRFFPRPGASLSVTFGAPLPEASVRATLGMGMGSSVRGSWRGDGGDGGYVRRWAVAEVETRIAVTELVQRAVEVLSRQVSGDLLTGPPYQHQLRI